MREKNVGVRPKKYCLSEVFFLSIRCIADVV